MTPADSRIDVRKTYKLYVGGAFPRSESGRSYVVEDASRDGQPRATTGSLYLGALGVGGQCQHEDAGPVGLGGLERRVQ